MNWVDIIILFILIYTMVKGIRLGLMLSIFNIIKVILSLIITKRYYPFVYGYIINNPKVYNIFKGITQFVLKILFYSKNKGNANFIADLISKGLLKIIINLFAIMLIFGLANILINLFLELFSFILKAPVLKQLNKLGGSIFGLIEGLFIVYLLNIVFSPIASTFPESFIGKGISGSIVWDYLNDINLMFNIMSIKTYI